MPCNGDPSGWSGDASPVALPPDGYWRHLKTKFAPDVVYAVAAKSEDRVGELKASTFPRPQQDEAARALATIGADGWVECVARYRCSEDDELLTRAHFDAGRCPRDDGGEVIEELIYERELAPSRKVEWAIAIHGMNTAGAWQEEFSWYIGTSQGRSVPVAVYKYGRVITGVILAFRRKKKKEGLREKLVTLQRQADSQGFDHPPDIIVHSFGTWLIGQILLDQLEARKSKKPRKTNENEIVFGRLILAGCILRPDFPWAAIKKAKMVEEVLLHYGTKDKVVPLAHWGIRDSGPSGRRGFDRDPDSGAFEVVNLRAEGYGHSDLFSVKKCVVDGTPLQKCSPGSRRHLDHTYQEYWKPFLTLPAAEFDSAFAVGVRVNPPREWKQAWWPLRGTVLPWIALPLLIALLVMVVGLIGEGVEELLRVAVIASAVAGALLVVFVLLMLLQTLVRSFRRTKDT